MKSLMTVAWAAALCAACGDEQKRIKDDFCHGEADGVLCNDGDPCTIDDRCGLGVCKGRPALDCSGLDDGSCVVGMCDRETVSCVARPVEDGTSCDDGDRCTLADACSGGVCGGPAKDCSASGSPCADAACDPESGACEVTPREDGAACDDGDPCTVGGLCDGGDCVEEPKDCGDLDAPCARGSCGASGECVVVAIPEGGACDDGNPCSEGETCVGDVCGGATLKSDGSACAFDDACRLPGTCHSGSCDAGDKECPAPAECHVAVCDSVGSSRVDLQACKLEYSIVSPK